MKRKVVKHGSATLTVSLPSGWVKRFGIKAGDEVDIIEIQKSIVISTDGSYSAGHMELDLHKLGFFDPVLVNSFYQLGYDLITLNFPKDLPNIISGVQEATQNCIGLEIVDQGNTTLQLKAITDVNQESFERILAKIFLMVQSMAKETITALQNRSFARLQSIESMQRTNKRFVDYCLRLMHKHGHVQYNLTYSYCALLTTLNYIAMDYRIIAESFKDYQGVLDERILLYCSEVNEYLKNFYHLFYKFDSQRVQDLLDLKPILSKKGHRLTKERTPEELMLLHFLLQLVAHVHKLHKPYIQIFFETDKRGSK